MAIRPDTELYQKPIRKFKALTFKQMEFFIRLMNPGSTEKEAAAAVKNLQKAAGFNITRNVVANGASQFDKKMSAAFWGFLCFAEKAKGDFFTVDFPAHIGFAIDDDVYKITAFDDKYHDKNLISLREAKKEDVIDVIVGINIPYEDVKQHMPKPPYKYLRLDVRNILEDIPKVSQEADEMGEKK